MTKLSLEESCVKVYAPRHNTVRYITEITRRNLSTDVPLLIYLEREGTVIGRRIGSGPSRKTYPLVIAK